MWFSTTEVRVVVSVRSTMGEGSGRKGHVDRASSRTLFEVSEAAKKMSRDMGQTRNRVQI